MFLENPNIVSLDESPEKEMRELVEIGEIQNHFFAVRRWFFFFCPLRCFCTSDRSSFSSLLPCLA